MIVIVIDTCNSIQLKKKIFRQITEKKSSSQAGFEPVIP